MHAESSVPSARASSRRFVTSTSWTPPRRTAFAMACSPSTSLTVLFIVFTTFLRDNSTLEWLDIVFGVLILLDFLARLAISRNRLRELAHPAAWADMAAIVSFLAPVAGEAAGFLRILRTVRLLHTYQLLARLRKDSQWFRRHEDVVLATVNLFVFLFVMSGIVYASQVRPQPRHQQLRRRALLHGHGADDDRLRRYHAAGDVRALHLNRHHDPRRHAFLDARPRAAAAAQGSLPLPDLRADAPRCGRRALQGVRNRVADPGRRILSFAMLYASGPDRVRGLPSRFGVPRMCDFGGSITLSKSCVNMAAAKNATARNGSLPVLARSCRTLVGKTNTLPGTDRKLAVLHAAARRCRR